MDWNAEKARLLDLIEIDNMYDEDEINISLSNIDLSIEGITNSENHNLTIICDIDVDSNDLEKYDKFNSEIALDYTLYDEVFSSII